MNALDKAIEFAGSQSALAALLKVDEMTVSQWKRRGVPPGRVLAIVDATDGEVTPYELRPDIYPDPDWLPPTVRKAKSKRADCSRSRRT